MQVKKGDIIEGVITGLTKYGAFVNTGGMSGMIHISEVSRDYVSDISKHLEINQEIKAVVIDIKGDRLALSIKQLPSLRPAVNPVKSERSEDFEDMLNKFKRDSDERIAGLKLEAKRAARVNRNKK